MAVPAIAYQAARQAWQHRPQVSVSSQFTAALLATGVAAGGFLGIRAVVNNFKQGLRERQALTEGNPAAFATQLKMAFENDSWWGWGTDEERVFITLEQIPDRRTMNRVANAYRDLYGRNLSADLSDELDSADYAAALEIINSKP